MSVGLLGAVGGAKALEQISVNRDVGQSMVLHLVHGERINQRELIRQLTSMQYTRNEVAIERGTYRVRGEVIDIHPAESDADAIRVELFDDEIESLSLFDPLTGERRRVWGISAIRSPVTTVPRSKGPSLSMYS